MDRGGAVLIFPEGTSLTDRQVVPLKTGAARLALGQERRPGQQGRLTLLPIGLHFVERTGFWTDVAVSVGRPIALAPFVEMAGTDETEAVRQLMAHIQAALERLILNIPAVDQIALVHGIEEIYRSELGVAPGTVGLDLARGMAECIDYFARTDPDRIALAWDRVRHQDRLASLPAQTVAVALAVVAGLGLHALIYFNWLSRQSRRIRLAFLKASNRRLVARLRRERLEIVRLCDASKRDFFAATGTGRDADVT